MRQIGKWIGRLLLLVAVAIAGLWAFGPYEPVKADVSFDASILGDDVEAYLAAREARFDDIKPDVQKQVIWAGEAGARTDTVVLYVHGFSASAGEIRPVPDQVAEALGANLVYTRLQGHGRHGSAMAETSVQGWMTDVAEALAVARAVGDRIIVISTSTGGTLMTAAAVQPDLMEGVIGQVFVSPNFAINNGLAPILTWPAARLWVPVVAGAERSFEPQNEGHAQFWTTRYPSVGVLPMAALVKYVEGLDYSAMTQPALFIYSREDQVVRHEATEVVIARYGGPKETEVLTMGPGDDSGSHVILGDVISPGQTAAGVARILDWAQGL